MAGGGNRFVLGQDNYFTDMGVDAVVQGKIDDPVLTGKRDGGFGSILGQWA
jgi:hypothetical protein